MSSLGSTVVGGFERELDFLPQEESSLPLYSSSRDMREYAAEMQRIQDGISDWTIVDDCPSW